MKKPAIIAAAAAVAAGLWLYSRRTGLPNGNAAAGPRLPAMPQMPSMPSMPAMPAMPGMPKMKDFNGATPNAPRLAANIDPSQAGVQF